MIIYVKTHVLNASGTVGMSRHWFIMRLVDELLL